MSDISAMTETGEIIDHKLQMLVLERRNASRNMARFYVLAIEPTLFGEMALVREWGRIGSWGRRRLDLHPNRAAAAESLDAWLVRKARRRYRSGSQISCPDRRQPFMREVYSSPGGAAQTRGCVRRPRRLAVGAHLEVVR